MVCDIRPQKDEIHRVRLTVGGDHIDYLGDLSTPTSDFTTEKCLINSIFSTKNAKGLCTDIKDFLFEHRNGKKRIHEGQIGNYTAGNRRSI